MQAGVVFGPTDDGIAPSSLVLVLGCRWELVEPSQGLAVAQ